jgi:hypothetical protein
MGAPPARPSRPPMAVSTYDSSDDLTPIEACEASAGPGSSPWGGKSLLHLCWIDGSRRFLKTSSKLQGPPLASKIALSTYDLNENDTTCFYISPEQQVDVGRRLVDSGLRGCVPAYASFETPRRTLVVSHAAGPVVVVARHGLAPE